MPCSRSSFASTAVRTPPYTRHPARASRSAEARPIPDDAPVTTTLFTRLIVACRRGVGSPT
jgi:hypothetical protein